ncbi:MAG TPA: hypothetical protein VGK19_05325 [Capsulimonadaceae bacterium]|jgi:hypothetical protein
MKTITLIVAAATLLTISVVPAKAQILQGILAGVAQQKILQGTASKPGKSGAPVKPVVKVGDEAYTGQYRFGVTKIQTLETYTTHYNDALKTPYVIQPMPGQQLLVIDCYAKNATTIPQELVFSSSATPNTAIIDAKKVGFRPLGVADSSFEGFDVRLDELSPAGAKILPGKTLSFAIVFGVPIGYKPDNLVFSVLNYSDRNVSNQKAMDVVVQVS